MRHGSMADCAVFTSPVRHPEDVVLDAELRADVHHRLQPGNYRLTAWNGRKGAPSIETNNGDHFNNTMNSRDSTRQQ